MSNNGNTRGGEDTNTFIEPTVAYETEPVFKTHKRSLLQHRKSRCMEQEEKDREAMHM